MAQILQDPRSLKISFQIPIQRTGIFWDGLRQGKIFAPKCRFCGRIFFPPQSDCPHCLKSEMDWIQLSGEAELETYTQIVARPSSFQNYEPYIVGIGKLKEGVKVVAWITGIELKDLKVGTPLKLIGKIGRDGNPTYEFIPR